VYVGGSTLSLGRLFLGLKLDFGPLGVVLIRKGGRFNETVLAAICAGVLDGLSAMTPTREHYHARLSGMM
jgi:hypothetical protein